jgi:hypothetical protein
MTPPRDDDHVVHALLVEQLEDLREHGQLNARKQAHPQHIHVLLHRRIDHLFRRAVEPRVDDIHARIPQGASDDLDTPVVPIKADLGEKYTDRLAHPLSFSVSRSRLLSRIRIS